MTPTLPCNCRSIARRQPGGSLSDVDRTAVTDRKRVLPTDRPHTTTHRAGARRIDARGMPKSCRLLRRLLYSPRSAECVPTHATHCTRRTQRSKGPPGRSKAVLANGHCTGHVPRAPGFFFLFEGPPTGCGKIFFKTNYLITFAKIICKGNPVNTF